VPNPFAGNAGAARTGAYANALRSYAPNPFAGRQAAVPATAMAPHLSQANPLGPDLTQAYRDIAADPRAQQYGQAMNVDLDRLWRMSPKSPIFQPGYSHNPYVQQRAEQLRQERLEREARERMTPEERAAADEALRRGFEGYLWTE
jgi:hypothetical protein